jgi:hypothetical protein
MRLMPGEDVERRRLLVLQESIAGVARRIDLCRSDRRFETIVLFTVTTHFSVITREQGFTAEVGVLVVASLGRDAWIAILITSA